MSWFLLPAAPSTAVEFSLAGGLTCIAMVAACVPAVLALRTVLLRPMTMRSVAAVPRRLAIVK
jgi:hypothetical protein